MKKKNKKFIKLVPKYNNTISKVTPEEYIYKLEILQSRISSLIYYNDSTPEGGLIVKKLRINNASKIKDIRSITPKIPLTFNKLLVIPEIYNSLTLFNKGDFINADLLTSINYLITDEEKFIRSVLNFRNIKSLKELSELSVDELVAHELKCSSGLSLNARTLNPEGNMAEINKETFNVSFDIPTMSFTITMHVNYVALELLNRYLTNYIIAVKTCKLVMNTPKYAEKYGKISFYVNNILGDIKDELVDPFAGIKDLILSANGLSSSDVTSITKPKYNYIKAQKQNNIVGQLLSELPDELFYSNTNLKSKDLSDAIDRAIDTGRLDTDVNAVDIDFDKNIYINNNISKKDIEGLISRGSQFVELFHYILNNPKPDQLSKAKTEISNIVDSLTKTNIFNGYLDATLDDLISIRDRLDKVSTSISMSGRFKSINKTNNLNKLYKYISNKHTANLQGLFEIKNLDNITDSIQYLKTIDHKIDAILKLFKYKVSEIDNDAQMLYEEDKLINNIVMRLHLIRVSIKQLFSYFIRVILYSSWKTPESEYNNSLDIVTNFLKPLNDLANGIPGRVIQEELNIIATEAHTGHSGSYYNSPHDYPEEHTYMGRSIRAMLQTNNRDSLNGLFKTELPQVVAAIACNGIKSLLIPTNIEGRTNKGVVVLDILDDASRCPLEIIPSTLYVRSNSVNPTRILDYINDVKNSIFNYIHRKKDKELHFNNSTTDSDMMTNGNLADIRYLKESDVTDSLIKKFNFEIFLNLVTLNGNPVNSSLLLSNFNSSFGFNAIEGIKNEYVYIDKSIIVKYMNKLRKYIDSVDNSYSINIANRGNIINELINSELLFGDLLLTSMSTLFNNVGGLDLYFTGALSAPMLFNINRQITDLQIKKKDLLLMQLLNNFFISYDNILLDENYSRTVADTIYNKDITFDLSKNTLLNYIHDDISENDINDTVSVTYNGSSVLNTMLLLFNNINTFRGLITKLDRNSVFDREQSINILTPLLIYMIGKLALNLRKYNEEFKETVRNSAMID